MDNPMLDTAQYAPIIDYIYHQKFVPSVPNPAADGPRLLPAQANDIMNRWATAAGLNISRWLI